MKRLTITLLLSLPLYLFAQTIISGGNISGVWNKCNSPYLIEGDIVIGEIDTLLIESGVEVIFQENYEFLIHGWLFANGDLTDSIRFTGAEITGSIPIGKIMWKGLIFSSNDDSKSSILNYTIIEYAETGISNLTDIAEYHEIHVNHTTIQYNLSGMYIFEMNSYLDNIHVINNLNWGISRYDSFYSYEDFEVTNFLISNNGLGVFIETRYGNFTNGEISYNFDGGMRVGEDDAGCHLENVHIHHNGNINSWFGGIYGLFSGIFIKNCTISYNISGGGGGIFTDAYSLLEIDNSIISNNYSAGDGGGIYHTDYTYPVKIKNSKIINNTAAFSGGGLFIVDSKAEISNSIIEGNQAQTGGGIFLAYIEDATIENVTITDNHATLYGGGMRLGSFYNSEVFSNIILHGNTADMEGGGIYFEYQYPPLEPTLFKNSIVRNNLPEEINGQNLSYLEFEYSNIQNGWPGTGNIDADPLFTDPANGDYSLSWANFPAMDATKSPCIDSGDPASPMDPDGTPADMGAYPFNQAAPYEPEILTITDVPDDQGLAVYIAWRASVTDDPLYNEITHYTLWREVAAAKSTWTYLGAVTADHSPGYSFTAPTLSDSSGAGVPWFTFKVIAETGDPATYYACQPDSGYSVDNIAPDPPSGLYGVYNNNKVALFWDPSPAADFDHFNVYERDLSTADPMVFIESTTGHDFGDPWLSFSDLEYTVTTVDVNGNESNPDATWQTTVVPGFYVGITVMLEGPFNGSGMNYLLNTNDLIPLSQPYNVSPWNYNGPETVLYIPGADIVDWVLLELRQALWVDYATSATVVARQAAFVKADGEVVAIDGLGWPRFDLLPSDDYYLVVWHRNHLGVLSATPISKIEESMSYDFTTGPGKYYQGPQGAKALAPGVWGMIAADMNGDGVVDESDKSVGWNMEAGKSGYLFSDANLDAHTNNQDKNQLLFPNSSMVSQIPENYQFSCGGPLYDYRDGRSYATVQIGDQCWMAENLNLGEMICGAEDQSDNGIIEKYCYGNLQSYCDTFGGFYQWDEMMDYSVVSGSQGICPQGWHVPSDADWCELEDYADSGSIDCAEVGWKGTDAGYRLKSGSGWLNNGNGGDDHGFTALPAGYRSAADGQFYRITKGSYLWSSDENDGATAWRTGMEYNFSAVNKGFQQKTDGRSVRCVKD